MNENIGEFAQLRLKTFWRSGETTVVADSEALLLQRPRSRML
jgi:hypothetical protein